MIKRLFIVIIVLLLALSVVSCKSNVELSIREHELINSDGETIEYYLAHKSKNEFSNKLLVRVQGSGRSSVKNSFGMGSEAATIGFDILFIEKYAYNNKELYDKTNSRKRRVSDIINVIEHVVKDLYKNNLNEIMLLADSEGGSIAPEILIKLKEQNIKVSHLIVLGAGGYPQAKEFEILLRKQLNDSERGFIYKAGIKSQKELQEQFNIIKNNPTPDKYWLGKTYKYWNSYLFYNPYRYIKRVSIPTLYIIGKNDKSVPFETVKYLKDNLGEQKNFEFHILDGLDHSFCDSEGNKKMPEIMKNIILPWYKNSEF